MGRVRNGKVNKINWNERFDAIDSYIICISKRKGYTTILYFNKMSEKHMKTSLRGGEFATGRR